MRVTRLVAVGLLLTCGTFSAAYAVNPDDLPWDDIDRVLKAVRERSRSEVQAGEQPERSAQQTETAAPQAAPPN